MGGKVDLGDHATGGLDAREAGAGDRGLAHAASVGEDQDVPAEQAGFDGPDERAAADLLTLADRWSGRQKLG